MLIFDEEKMDVRMFKDQQICFHYRKLGAKVNRTNSKKFSNWFR